MAQGGFFVDASQLQKSSPNHLSNGIRSRHKIFVVFYAIFEEPPFWGIGFSTRLGDLGCLQTVFRVAGAEMHSGDC